VTFDHSPLNIFGPETIPQLNEIITALETDEQVKVVVFDSAVDGFFLTHYNFLAKLEDTTSLPPGSTGLGTHTFRRSVSLPLIASEFGVPQVYFARIGTSQWRNCLVA